MGNIYTPPYSLYSPELMNSPISITPNLDVADKNTFEIKLHQGKISHTAVTESYFISWPVQKNAVSYTVYGSLSPISNSNILADKLTTTEYEFNVPFFGQYVMYFFWVSFTDSKGNVTYLADSPTTLESSAITNAKVNPIALDPDFMPDTDGMNAEILKDFAYIRKAHQFMTQNDGEDFLLYLKRSAEDKPWGMPCTCVDKVESVKDQFDDEDEDDLRGKEDDSDYQGRERCKLCFGTGIYGGYYPSIPIRIVYQGDVQKSFKWVKGGRLIEHSWNSTMTFAPTIRVGDLVVRTMDGSRYTVGQKNATSKRGVPFHQDFNLQAIPLYDMRMEVTDLAIQQGLQQANFPDFFKNGYKVFG